MAVWKVTLPWDYRARIYLRPQVERERIRAIPADQLGNPTLMRDASGAAEEKASRYDAIDTCVL
jgi:hypothetical protein